MTTQDFILKYRTSDVAQAALLVRQYKDVDHEFALRQIEGWQKACTKLPEISRIDDWHYPVRLSMEQCSSEQTARYKRAIVDRLNSEALNSEALNGAATPLLIDLTGGFGIDAYYMGTTDYVEQNAELCQVVQHNMTIAQHNTRVHCAQAEDYIQTIEHSDIIYLDPARRDSHGGKVFRLEDCTPNVVELYPTLMSRCDALMLKLSPMLDITEALRRLPDAREVHVVAVKNEVKEVLIVCHKQSDTLSYICVNLGSNEPAFEVYESDDRPIGQTMIFATKPGTYIYEPNAAIMKAGLFNEVSWQYELVMLGENSHLYTSDEIIDSFPGRIWLAHEASKEELKALTQANILTRNYPLRPEEIKKKYRLKDGGDTYVIGSRIAKKPILLIGTIVK